jgi:hypothetical protein
MMGFIIEEPPLTQKEDGRSHQEKDMRFTEGMGSDAAIAGVLMT